MAKSKSTFLRKYLLAYSLPTLWAGFIFLLSNQEVLPGFTISAYDFIFKKAAHMFVYALLYLLLFRAYQKTTDKPLHRQSYTIPLFISFLYALTDELHQGLVPGRHPTLRDAGYDMLGVLTVLLHQLKYL
jgi:VanZ family protein